MLYSSVLVSSPLSAIRSAVSLLSSGTVRWSFFTFRWASLCSRNRLSGKKSGTARKRPVGHVCLSRSSRIWFFRVRTGNSASRCENFPFSFAFLGAYDVSSVFTQQFYPHVRLNTPTQCTMHPLSLGDMSTETLPGDSSSTQTSPRNYGDHSNSMDTQTPPREQISHEVPAIARILFSRTQELSNKNCLLRAIPSCVPKGVGIRIISGALQPTRISFAPCTAPLLDQ